MKLSSATAFCHRFGTGLGAGADLLQLLDSEAKQGPASQRRAMADLAAGARRGEHLSALMEKDKFFPPLMTAMTRVGEATGRLERVLLALGEHYQHQLQTRRSFLSSIAMPLLQLVGGILVISLLIYLMGVLTPAGGGQMTDLLGFGLRGGRGVLIFWGYLAVFFGLIGLGIWCFTRNIGGIQNLVPLVYMIPVIGPSIQTITISRFCWNLAMALESGLDPIRSIRLSLDSTDSEYYRAGAEDAEQAIRKGATLAEAIKATSVFPDDFIGRIEIAEHSGTDAESIAYLAREYDERAKSAVKMLARTATILIRVFVVLVLVFLIFRIASVVFGFYDQALEPINARQRR
ncbi:MAG: type II secretion system F family protein [Rubripirellula sp.]